MEGNASGGRSECVAALGERDSGVAFSSTVLLVGRLANDSPVEQFRVWEEFGEKARVLLGTQSLLWLQVRAVVVDRSWIQGKCDNGRVCLGCSWGVEPRGRRI